MKIKYLFLLMGTTLLWSCGGNSNDSSSNEEYSFNSSPEDEVVAIDYSATSENGDETTTPSYDENEEMETQMPAMPAMPEMGVSDDSGKDKAVDKNQIKEEVETLLKEYKKLTDEAISLSKKVKGGDEDAKVKFIQKTSECTTLAAKIMDLAEKVDDPSLIAKYQKINVEYINKLK